jgi:hypothetical protein
VSTPGLRSTVSRAHRYRRRQLVTYNRVRRIISQLLNPACSTKIAVKMPFSQMQQEGFRILSKKLRLGLD